VCNDNWASARVDWLSCAQATTALVLRNASSLSGAYFQPSALGVYSFSLRASWAAGGWSGGAEDSVPRGAECAEIVASVAVQIGCNRSPVAIGPGSITTMRGLRNQFQPVVLLANSSYDPDPEDTVLAFQWVLISAPVASLLKARNLTGWQSSQFLFTPDADGVFVFTLDVSDGCSSSQDTVRVTVGCNRSPVASSNADTHSTSFVPTTGNMSGIILDGSYSFDPDGPDDGECETSLQLPNFMLSAPS
jgi:hypothetical protein